MTLSVSEPTARDALEKELGLVHELLGMSRRQRRKMGAKVGSQPATRERLEARRDAILLQMELEPR